MAKSLGLFYVQWEVTRVFMFLKDHFSYCEKNTFQEARSQKYQVGSECSHPLLKMVV